ncbi:MULTISPECIES: hypothetical protein [Pseudanabaena]|uniref:Uncharacterized protein n=2 Tax=Pseudanabaena TaxID=1152 RepID=L8MY98_9CYAN|nr:MULTISPECIES: hypothetical protein [Pseudanabaena]ELS32461.1 hypothetical protein Pse7429DRAFT_2656 [Pseudanabaena biceps PCC 7429]MDG3495318.1 hypothetical protein [Pseudanabaena catenata USMAC16]
MKNGFVGALVFAVIATTAGSSEARPIRDGARYWEFSRQEVESVMREFGGSPGSMRFLKELDRRCNEGHRTQNLPRGRNGLFTYSPRGRNGVDFISTTRFFCAIT